MRKTILLVLFLGLLFAAGSSLSPWGAPLQVDAATTPPELRVLGFNTFLAGSPASLRIISYDPSSGRGIPNVPVSLTLEFGGDKPPLPLLHGKTNTHGTFDAQFQIPAGLQGSGILRIKSPMVAGDDLQAPVTIRKEQKLYLTTDKPLYQPGQTVHVRLLALREPDLVPIAEHPVTLEIEDAKGNKVFKKVTPTSRFGVVGAAFELATEVNMGEFHVKAFLDAETSEKSFTVKRYVLPKFKVVVKTDKSYYLPSDKIHGTVQADYFFGKPVSGARIAVKLSTFDVGERELAVIEGTTHADGSFTFDSTLPSQFVGRPLDQGAAPLSILAEVTDTANHKESGPLALKVVSSPLKAEIFPESGRLEPGLENLVYVVTSYPDGSPAACDLSVTIDNKVHKAKTDATGFGTFTFTPHPIAMGPAPINRWRGQVSYVPPPPTVAVQISAHDSRGNTAQLSPSLTQTAGQDSILLRTDKALYRVGDTLNAQIFSTRKGGSVYVDFVRNGQTVLTQSVDLSGGRGQLHMDLAADLSGAMTVNAYEIAASQDVIRDTRQIFVQPARDLMVDVRMDRSTYLPGQDAKLTFLVKDKQGAPRLAVLGVDIVDESLFALAEKEPGLERVYFLLEREMMQSRYEVHGFQMADAVKDPRNVDNASRQNLSRALFSQSSAPAAFTLRVDSFDAKRRQLADRMMRVQQVLYVYRQHHGHDAASVDDLVADRLLGADAVRDIWGRNFRIRMLSGTAVVYSVGPDGKDGTADDVSYQDAYQEMYADNGMALGGDMLAVRGGAGGGGAMDREMRMMAPMGATNAAAPLPVAQAKSASLTRDEKDKSGASAPTGVREFFPETLVSNPQVITDESGQASLVVPMADSITTWRVGAFASSLSGEMGNGEGRMRVFQDFFVDIDLPVSLTQDDEISVPVAVYNYLPQAQDVTLSLDKDTWFQLQDEPTRKLHLGKNEVSVVYFKMRAQQPGTHRLTVKAQGSKMADAVRRSVDIVPNGQAFETVFSDRLAGNVSRHLVLPQDAIAGASKIMLTVYPGIFAQVVEGMDNILRMPGGCFEQTSSTTYPNVLVLDYLKRVRKITPEIQMKADGFINTGYQRLLTFEVKGGGFSVFGQVPANPILTAYGVMEFADMAKVHDIDPTLVNRTRAWLLAQQQKDGSWSAGREGFYAEGWSNVPNSSLVSTAYITWALLETGEKGPGVQRAVAYIKEHLQQAEDPYTASLVANALVAELPQDPMTQKALAILASMRIEDKDVVYWRTKIATAAFGTGQAGDIETTALATLALLGSDRYTSDVNKAITYLVRSKDAYGTWQSTQATILAMKALVRSIDKASEKADASVAVSLNGKPASSFKITRADSDVFRQIDLTALAKAGENTVDLRFSGEGNCMYKIVGEFYRPWKGAIQPPEEPLALDVSYDRTRLAMNDTVDCSVKVQNRTNRTANMVMLDVGVPPGFDVSTSDLEAMVAKRTIEKFSSTGRQVIIYLEKIEPSANLAFSFHMKARFPIRALAPRSRAYEYYNPKREALAPPIKMEVTPRH